MQRHFWQKRTLAWWTTSQIASLATSQRKDTLQNSHLCSRFLWWFPATIPVIWSFCVHSIMYSPFHLPVLMKKLSCARWKLGGFGHRFRCPLAGAAPPPLPHPTQQFPLTVKNFHLIEKLKLLPSLSYLDPLEDFFAPWTAVCIADLSVKGRRGRECDGRRDGVGGGGESDWGSYV